MTARTTAPATALPAPTPTELAAIRARLRGRPGPTGDVSRATAGVLFVLPLTLVGIGVVLMVVNMFRGDGATIAWALGCTQTGLAILWLVDDVAGRTADRAVTERLRLDGILPTVRRTGHPTLVAAVIAGLLGVAVLGTTVLVTLSVTPAPLAAAAAAASALLLVTHLVLLHRELTAPGVTGTPVLDAVNAAVTRSRIAERVQLWAPMGLPTMTLLHPASAGAPDHSIGGVVFVTGFAAWFGAVFLLHRDRKLLEEPRLRDVRPSTTSWLAGSTASVPPYGGLPR